MENKINIIMVNIPKIKTKIINNIKNRGKSKTIIIKLLPRLKNKIIKKIKIKVKERLNLRIKQFKRRLTPNSP